MMNGSKRTNILIPLIFTLSLLLRLGLTLVNREANDNHMFVVRFTLLTGKLAQKDICSECFQPKLYHYTVARSIKELGISKKDKDAHILVGQMVNFVAGIIILLVGWIFIKQASVRNENIKWISFSLLALNPALIGINAQATNDTFVILFSTLALYFAYRYFLKPKIWIFALVILFTTLTVSSKTNGWVTAIAIFGALIIRVYLTPDVRLKNALLSIIFLVCVPGLAFFNPLNQYNFNYQKYGSPILLNMDAKPPAPYFFEKTTYSNPGILSVQDGFLTFKFIELLKHPFSPCETEEASVCTSLWTQLYARNHSLHFFKYPSTWINNSEKIYTLTRWILIFALPITIFFMAGTMISAINFVKIIFLKPPPNHNDYGIFTLTFLGYASFIMLYSYTYREISFMKPIFIFPGILALIKIFLKGTDAVYVKDEQFRRNLFGVFQGLVSILLILYVTDIIIMILQLRIAN